MARKKKQTHKTTKSNKYVNPSKVPKKKKKKIHKTDPRNSNNAKELLDDDFEIDDSNISSYEPISSEDLFGESMDPEVLFAAADFDTTIPTPEGVMEESLKESLEEPKNLSIDTNSFTIEDGDAGSDGTVRFVASLYFDDVEGAEDYEYVITAKS